MSIDTSSERGIANSIVGQRGTYALFYLIGRRRGGQPKNLGNRLKFQAKCQHKSIVNPYPS